MIANSLFNTFPIIITAIALYLCVKLRIILHTKQYYILLLLGSSGIVLLFELISGSLLQNGLASSFSSALLGFATMISLISFIIGLGSVFIFKIHKILTVVLSFLLALYIFLVITTPGGGLDIEIINFVAFFFVLGTTVGNHIAVHE